MGTFDHRILVSVIVYLFFIITSAQIVSSLINYHENTEREIHVRGDANIMALPERIITYSTYYHIAEDSTESTTNLKSWRSQNLPNLYNHRQLRTAQGILNIIGWGILLPVGAVIARYFRKFPMHWNKWYSFHVICQSGGYVLGTIGWFVGLLASKAQHSDDIPYRILGIVIFVFTTIQMLAIVWQPRKEDEVYYCCRKSWEIYHHLLGYALIALIIADIFQGLKHQNQAHEWRWTYVGIVGFLGLTAVSLEIFKWVKSKIIQDTVELNSDIYTSN